MSEMERNERSELSDETVGVKARWWEAMAEEQKSNSKIASRRRFSK